MPTTQRTLALLNRWANGNHGKAAVYYINLACLRQQRVKRTQYAFNPTGPR